MTRYGGVLAAFGLTVLLVTAAATPAAAQPLGTFQWTTAPFCNVLTLAVTGTGSAFRLEGTDNSCGGTPASAIGMAYVKPDGTVGVGLTLVFASAVSLHIDATINPGAGFNGSWSDSVGRNGSLVFGPGTGGPLRPVVAPVITYGGAIAQPAGGGDRGLSVAVTTDTGPAGDAAAVFGQFGGATGFTAPGSAGVRGDSAELVGVMGTTNSGWGVVGGAGANGIAVQGYAEGVNSVGVHAVHAGGGTALDINNGTIKVSGSVRPAFVINVDINDYTYVDHPLLNNDPNALVFLTAHAVFVSASAQYVPAVNRWLIATFNPQIGFGQKTNVSVLVLKQ